MFSFVIVNYQTKEMSAACLDSIFKNCPRNEFEIILVDNNSGDGSLDYLRGKFKDSVLFIAAQENLGFGKANNLGAQKAKGDYLFFLNSDTVLKGNILTAIGDCFKNDENIGLVGGRLILPDGREQPHAYGRFPNCFNFIKIKFYKNFAAKSQWASGAALVVRKNLFEKMSGFDEKFFMYFEDVDLCLRAYKSGFKTVVCPAANVVHFGGQSPLSDKSRKTRYYQAQDYFVRKHYGAVGFYLMRFLRGFYLLIK